MSQSNLLHNDRILSALNDAFPIAEKGIDRDGRRYVVFDYIGRTQIEKIEEFARWKNLGYVITPYKGILRVIFFELFNLAKWRKLEEEFSR